LHLTLLADTDLQLYHHLFVKHLAFRIITQSRP